MMVVAGWCLLNPRARISLHGRLRAMRRRCAVRGSDSARGLSQSVEGLGLQWHGAPHERLGYCRSRGGVGCAHRTESDRVSWMLAAAARSAASGRSWSRTSRHAFETAVQRVPLDHTPGGSPVGGTLLVRGLAAVSDRWSERSPSGLNATGSGEVTRPRHRIAVTRWGPPLVGWEYLPTGLHSRRRFAR